VVIFLHGYTDSWFSYSRVLELLPPRYHGFALTQRGHGGSDKPLTGYGMSDFAADVVAFMDHFGIRKAAIVGHSMGSVIAQRVAIDHPDRVSKLVLVGATPFGANEVVLGLLDFVLTLEDPIDPVFVREFQVSTTFGPVPADFLDTVVGESLKVPARVWKDALSGFTAEDLRDELDRIMVPTLIAYGDQDTVFPFSDQQELDAGIPDSTLLIYPQTGHGVHWEQPERFTADLAAFLKRGRRR
jgi:non-heme chloroperoxidase